MSALPPGRRSTRSTAQPLVPGLSNEWAPRKHKPKPKCTQPQPNATPKPPPLPLPAPPASTNNVVVAERAPSASPAGVSHPLSGSYRTDRVHRPVAPTTPASSTLRPAAAHPPVLDAPAFVPPPFAAFKTQFSELMHLSSSEQELRDQLMSSCRAPLALATSMFTPDALPVLASSIGPTTITATAAAVLTVAAGASPPSTADSLPIPASVIGSAIATAILARPSHQTSLKDGLSTGRPTTHATGRQLSCTKSNTGCREDLPPRPCFVPPVLARSSSEDTQSSEEKLADILKGGDNGFDDDGSEDNYVVQADAEERRIKYEHQSNYHLRHTMTLHEEDEQEERDFEREAQDDPELKWLHAQAKGKWKAWESNTDDDDDDDDDDEDGDNEQQQDDEDNEESEEEEPAKQKQKQGGKKVGKSSGIVPPRKSKSKSTTSVDGSLNNTDDAATLLEWKEVFDTQVEMLASQLNKPSVSLWDFLDRTPSNTRKMGAWNMFQRWLYVPTGGKQVHSKDGTGTGTCQPVKTT
ncbi:hypothetical protein B0H17DRAFT_1217949 [Mycena rosella]|uniref:Uncharacterized protein n=1 Tax=Mycena rosella TaxID=1033263 RepID=A0AAD7BSW8_MYCRO|nr:hypothetical protein B0H17DRAFT_1217949 [Mycena rosella]